MSPLATSLPPHGMYTESEASQRERGIRARQALPLRKLGDFVAVKRDPVKLIDKQNKGRIHSLVPLRHYRMAASPFTFYRGSAGLMAHDLAHQPQTGIQIVICGDAHISNFGLYASPERRLVFDLNDFDEAAPGPWEWDVRRMLTSLALAARENGETPEHVEKIVLSAATSYRTSLAKLLEVDALSRHYYSVDDTFLAKQVRASGINTLEEVTNKAKRRDSDRAIAKLMGPDTMGYIRFKDEPPVLTPVHVDDQNAVEDLFEEYARSTSPEIGYLLTRYTLTDVARRVVGVGSVGTRCFVIALTGPEGKGLVLQAKEALTSVVQEYSEPNITTPPTLPPGTPNGLRVISQQRILQAFSDPFLGHLDANGRSFYVRQFRDYKGSFDTSLMNRKELTNYGALCALLLARAHSQNPLAHWIGGYIGDSKDFDEGMTQWSLAYADQGESDYKEFMEAIASGRIKASSEDGATNAVMNLTQVHELGS